MNFSYGLTKTARQVHLALPSRTFCGGLTLPCIESALTLLSTMSQEDLIDYMRNRDFQRLPTPDEESLAQRNEEHGRAVFIICF